MYKIYMIVIRKRLQDVLEEHFCETQFGFRPSHSASQAIFITLRLQDIAEQQGSNMVLTFLDWEKAFDRVQRWSFMDGSTPLRYSRWFYFCSKGLLLQDVIFRRRWVWMFKQEEAIFGNQARLFVLLMSVLDQNVSFNLRIHNPILPVQRVYYTDCTILITKNTAAANRYWQK